MPVVSCVLQITKKKKEKEKKSPSEETHIIPLYTNSVCMKLETGD